jgi:hypothetical protein
MMLRPTPTNWRGARIPPPIRYGEPVTEPDWLKLASQLEPDFQGAGFDLSTPFSASAYNRAAPDHPLPGRHDGLGVLIGNTRALWPSFVTAHATSPHLSESEHPLDRYVTEQVTRIVARTGRRAEIVFAHVTEPTAFPIQRLAELIGFAVIAPSHLAIHPEHGPWFALRAVVVLDCAGPDVWLTRSARPCAGCAAPCVAALERALQSSGPKLDGRSVAAHARDWIAVRDVCPVGRASRYGENQLAYHYGIDRSRPRADD